MISILAWIICVRDSARKPDVQFSLSRLLTISAAPHSMHWTIDYCPNLKQYVSNLLYIYPIYYRYFLLFVLY